jgi:hypothetical protein
LFCSIGFRLKRTRDGFGRRRSERSRSSSGRCCSSKVRNQTLITDFGFYSFSFSAVRRAVAKRFNEIRYCWAHTSEPRHPPPSPPPSPSSPSLILGSLTGCKKRRRVRPVHRTRQAHHHLQFSLRAAEPGVAPIHLLLSCASSLALQRWFSGHSSDRCPQSSFRR